MREEIEDFGVAVNERRFEAAQFVDELADIVVAHFIRRDEEAAHEPRVHVFTENLRARHAERLMPEARLPIAETPAGPFRRAERARPAHFELATIGVKNERLAGGAARSDLEHFF